MTIKPRIKLPEKAQVGEVIEIKTLITHIMETGQRKDQDGKTIPRSIVNRFTASFAGQEIFKATLHPGTSANPYLHFYMRVPGPGAFTFTWVDDAGTTTTDTQPLNVI